MAEPSRLVFDLSHDPGKILMLSEEDRKIYLADLRRQIESPAGEGIVEELCKTRRKEYEDLLYFFDHEFEGKKPKKLYLQAAAARAERKARVQDEKEDPQQPTGRAPARPTARKAAKKTAGRQLGQEPREPLQSPDFLVKLRERLLINASFASWVSDIFDNRKMWAKLIEYADMYDESVAETFVRAHPKRKGDVVLWQPQSFDLSHDDQTVVRMLASSGDVRGFYLRTLHAKLQGAERRNVVEWLETLSETVHDILVKKYQTLYEGDLPQETVVRRDTPELREAAKTENQELGLSAIDTADHIEPALFAQFKGLGYGSASYFGDGVIDEILKDKAATDLYFGTLRRIRINKPEIVGLWLTRNDKCTKEFDKWLKKNFKLSNPDGTSRKVSMRSRHGAPNVRSAWTVAAEHCGLPEDKLRRAAADGKFTLSETTLRKVCAGFLKAAEDPFWCS